MIAIREEIRAIEDGRADPENNVLKNAPHPASVVMATEWSRPYTREQAAFPAAWVRASKFWPTTGTPTSGPPAPPGPQLTLAVDTVFSGECWSREASQGRAMKSPVCTKQCPYCTSSHPAYGAASPDGGGTANPAYDTALALGWCQCTGRCHRMTSSCRGCDGAVLRSSCGQRVWRPEPGRCEAPFRGGGGAAGGHRLMGLQLWESLLC